MSLGTGRPNGPSRRIRVMVVDDHEMVAQGLARMIDDEPDLELVGVAGTVAEAVSCAQREVPDVVLMDYRLPDGDGASATASVRAPHPQIKVVILTGEGSEDILMRSIECGAVGMISKARPGEDVVAAIRAASRGDSILRLDELAGLLGRISKKSGGDGGVLSERELEVLRLLAKAKSTDAIAAELFLSVHTVRNHISNILSKLGAHSKLEAVIMGMRLGLLPLDEIG